MKMIPPTVSESCSSDAERKVFGWLSQTELAPGSRAYHSLNLPRHVRKHEGEIDFLVLSPRGFLVLEVKGGGVSCHDGRWEYVDRFGVRRPGGEGPFEQAKTAMYSLRSRLIEHIGPEARSLLHGYGAVFPDCVFEEDGAEWVPAMVLDARTPGPAGMKRFLEELTAHWTGGRRRPDPPRRLIDAVAAFVRPEFDRLPSIGAWADDITRECVRLTAEQCHALDLVEAAPRILFTGGAGTGKTFLAAEIARRHARRGETTLLTCQSPTLASFLRDEVAEPAVTVLPFEHVGSSRDAPWEVLIVDEGQDLLNSESLLALDDVLVDGISEGRWRIFLDPNNQAGLTGAFDPAALAELEGYGALVSRLTRNLRNTEEIVAHINLLTKADVGVPTLGSGPRVETVDVEDEQSEGRALSAWIRRLENDGVSPGRISVVSPRSFDESAVRHIGGELLGRMLVVSPSSVQRWPGRRLTFSTISDLKGLENEFVALVDLRDGLLTPERRSALYVALSRARVGLWLAVAAEARPALRRLLEENLPMATGGNP